DVATQRRDWTGALDWYSRAQVLLDHALGPEHPIAATNLVNTARMLVELGRGAEALPKLETARKTLEQKLPPEHPDRGELEWVSGAAALAVGDNPGARARLEKAVAILGGADSEDPSRVALVRFDLARALWSDPAARRRARTLATEARAALTDKQAPERDAVDRWLASHR